MFDFISFCKSYNLTINDLTEIHTNRILGKEGLCPVKSLYLTLISKLRRVKGVVSVEKYGDNCFITVANDNNEYMLTFYNEEES